MRKSFVIAVLFLALVVVSDSTAVPMQLNHQGRLTDAVGSTVANGLYSFTFTLYDHPDPVVGIARWSSGVQQISVEDGLFSYNLGENVTLSSEIFVNDTSLWLGIKVGTDAEMSPRSLITTSPKSAVSVSVNGDIKTEPGKIHVPNLGSSGMDGVSIASPRPNNLRITNLGSEGQDGVRFIISPDTLIDSGIVVLNSINSLDHHGHVTILKIANGGLDTTEVVDIFGDPDFAQINIGDGSSPDSGIVVTNSVSAVDHHGHVTILKIANGGLDTTEVVDIFGDPDFAQINIGDGSSPDSGIVVTNSVSAVDHHGHVTILKIANGGLDTTGVIDLFGDPDFAQINVGDGSSPDSGIVVTNSVSAVDHHGHVTILKIANGGLDTTGVIDLFGDPDFAQINVGDGDSPDSGIVVSSGIDKTRHHGHVTILKIANGGLDTSNVVSLSGDDRGAQLQMNDGGGSGGAIFMGLNQFSMVDSTGDTSHVMDNNGNLRSGGKKGYDYYMAKSDMGIVDNIGDTLWNIDSLGSAAFHRNLSVGSSASLATLTVTGGICATGNIGACSDARYKKDVSGLSNSLDKILQLRGVHYKWKQDEYPDYKFDDGTHIGFIAQEIELLYPDMVMTDNNGYKSVDYGRLTPALVEAIKDQQNQIDELKQMVEKLISATQNASMVSSK